MTTLANTIEALARTLYCHAAVYAAARTNHPALAPYETIDAVLAALVDRAGLTADERDPILIAVATEHQRTRHALWTSILLKAFAPMLVHLRRRCRSNSSRRQRRRVGRRKLPHPRAGERHERAGSGGRGSRGDGGERRERGSGGDERCRALT